MTPAEPVSVELAPMEHPPAWDPWDRAAEIEIGLLWTALPAEITTDDYGPTLGLTVPLNPILAVDLRIGKVWSTQSETGAVITDAMFESLKYVTYAPEFAFLTQHGGAALRFTPIRGEATVFGRPTPLAVYTWSGAGWARTLLDTVVYSPNTYADLFQVHPTTIVGAGATVGVGRRLSLRWEVERMDYLEVTYTYDTTLEYRRWWGWSMGLSYRIPTRR